jgi:hypothetical protein
MLIMPLAGVSLKLSEKIPAIRKAGKFKEIQDQTSPPMRIASAGFYFSAEATAPLARAPERR